MQQHITDIQAGNGDQMYGYFRAFEVCLWDKLTCKFQCRTPSNPHNKFHENALSSFRVETHMCYAHHTKNI